MGHEQDPAVGWGGHAAPPGFSQKTRHRAGERSAALRLVAVRRCLMDLTVITIFAFGIGIAVLLALWT
jgi:O-succinylbenzoate synthase